MCATNGLKFTHHFRLWAVLLNVFVKLQKAKNVNVEHWFWCVQYKQKILTETILDSFYKLKVTKLKAKIRDWRWVGGMIDLEIEGCKTDIIGISLALKLI